MGGVQDKRSPRRTRLEALERGLVKVQEDNALKGWGELVDKVSLLRILA